MDRGRVPGTERTSVPTIVKQHPHISRQCVAEGDQLICPECRGIFYVLSIHPPEFHWASSCALGSLFTEALIAKGMNDTCSNHDISQVVEKARGSSWSLRNRGTYLVESITVNVWTQLDSVPEMMP
jgi:hypothetical protein